MIERNVALAICTIMITLSTLGACGGGDDDSGGSSKSGNNNTGSAMQSGTGGNSSGGGGDKGSAGMGGGAGNSSSAPKTNCTSDKDCGISQECVACGLNDTAGWCSFKKECMFDDDCAPDKCGYNVVTSDYRCLPKMYCPQ